MTRVQTKNTGRTKRAKATPKRPVVGPGATPPRVIRLIAADQLADTVDGVPDLLSTRAICFGVAAFCLLAAFWPLVAYALSPPRSDLGLVAPALLLLAAALGMTLVVILVRSGLRAGAWFSIRPSGFHYGDGNPELEKDRAAGTLIEWSSIVPNAAAPLDVRLIQRSGPEGLQLTRLGFWTRSPDGGLVERTVPLCLIETRLTCLRFLNADALRHALLRGMAARPGLRFHPEVFVEAGVDPETWRPTRKPRGAEWAILAASMAGVLGVGAIISEKTPVLLVAIGTLIPLGLGLVATGAFRRAAYPGLKQIIRFNVEATGRAAPSK